MRSWSSSGVFRGVYSKGCQTGALLGVALCSCALLGAYCARMVSSDPGGVLLGGGRYVRRWRWLPVRLRPP